MSDETTNSLTDSGLAALSQAESSIGHAVEVLDAANITGLIRDDAALLAERIAAALNRERRDWHISRSWPGTGTPCEDECPCPQESCGHVAESNVRSDCAQHGIHAAKTIRSTHAPDDCPGKEQP